MNFEPLIPSVIAVVLAIVTRKMIPSLACALLVGCLLQGDFVPSRSLYFLAESLWTPLSEPDPVKTLLFIPLVGGLMALIQKSGGIVGFLSWLDSKAWINTERRAGLSCVLLGIPLFVESTLSIFINGMVHKPLFERYRMSRERLAFLVASVSSPICVMIPFNSWGSYVLTFLTDVESPVLTYGRALALNFFPMAILAISCAVATGFLIGPMRQAEERACSDEPMEEDSTTKLRLDKATHLDLDCRVRNFLGPLLLTVFLVPVFLIWTGHGSLYRASGSTSVLAAVAISLLFTLVGYRWQGAPGGALLSIAWSGVRSLLLLDLMLALAVSLGEMSNEMGAGQLVGQLAGGGLLPTWSLVPVFYLLAAVVSFVVGTSWGTWAIILPIAMPAAAVAGIHPSCALAAILSGGLFGDLASPLSDTTFMSSLAAGVGIPDKVRTSLLYYLLAGGIALVGFVVVGLWF
jgi:tetracycline resistance efflux pump